MQTKQNYKIDNQEIDNYAKPKPCYPLQHGGFMQVGALYRQILSAVPAFFRNLSIALKYQLNNPQTDKVSPFGKLNSRTDRLRKSNQNESDIFSFFKHTSVIH